MYYKSNKSFTVHETIEDSDTAARLEFHALREAKTQEVDHHHQNEKLTTFWAKLVKEHSMFTQSSSCSHSFSHGLPLGCWFSDLVYI